MMQLKFAKPFLSVQDFDPIDLPDFTLLTGPNGSGKSHLLRAISEQSVQVDSLSPGKGDIKLFDWNTMVPQDGGAYSGQSQKDRRAQLFNHAQTNGVNGATRIVNAARAIGIRGLELADALTIATLTYDDLLARLDGDEQKARQAADQINNAVLIASNNILQGVSEEQKIELRQLAEAAGKPIFLLNQHDFSTMQVSWGQTDLFQQSFAQLFVAYREIWRNNELRRLAKMEGRTDVTCLSSDEFRALHRQPPWDFVNETLRSAGLPFQINAPDEFGDMPFEISLTKLSSGAKVKFADLSSGEKVIMSFALCVYYADDTRQSLRYPKLLLLDEVDAPLHPSMCRGFINTINETLVGRNGIKVIATTHSPSTVAMAPEESIFALEPDRRGPRKVSKSAALNLLTAGVPTLALNYDGRRQVLVESPNDARIYDLLFQTLKPKLTPGRSLAFVETSTSGGHTNTGCDVVIRLVNEFVANGNSSIFGLIDWDGKHDSTDRIVVLAAAKRNGLENVLLDPLLLAAAIARDVRALASAISIPEELNYFGFCELEAPALQPIVDQVVRAILKDKLSGERSKVRYLRGFELEIDNAYLVKDDHALASAIFELNPLQKLAKGTSSTNLMLAMVDPILRENPGFAPMELVDTFERLLSAPSHI